LENNSWEVPSPRKIHKIALQASNPHIFPTTTPYPVILTQKIPESLLLLFSAFIGEFQDQLFDESSFFSRISKASVP
jgi:hypothetical protein